MLIKSISVVYQTTLKTLQRFPLPALCSLLSCYFFLYFIHTKNPFFKLPHIVVKNYERSFFTLLFGFLFFIFFQLLIENRKGSFNRDYFFGMTLFSAIAWYLYGAPFSIELFFTSVLIVAGLFLSLLVAPCFYKPRFSLQSWSFSYQLCAHLCFSVLSSFVLFLGLWFVLGSIEKLFAVSFYDFLYLDIFFIIFTLIFPVVVMSGIPKKIDNLEIRKLKYINTVLNYLVAPMLFIYTVIIWAYLLKIIIRGELPKNIIVLLTSVFSFLGITTYLSSYPMHHDQSIIGAFGRHFFKLLPVHLLAFSVGLGVRIYHYGITESRYFTLLFLVWLILSTGVAFLRKAEEIPKFVLTSLPILLFAASFGPWSAINLSIYSQRHRLAVILEKNQILVEGKIQKNTQQLTLTERQNISSIITYIVNREKVDCLRSWLTPDQATEINQKEKYHQTKLIMQAMGVEVPIDTDKPKR